MNYYFFAASLPALSLESAPSLTAVDFVAQCEEHLSPADLEGIRTILQSEGSDDAEPEQIRMHPFVADWQERDTDLRNAIVRERAGRTGRDAARYLHEQAGFDSYRQRAVSDAFSRGDPLQTELALDRLRWHEIEELEGADTFASNAILGYTLKLQLATRWSKLDAEKGMARIDKTAAVLAQPVEANEAKVTQ